MNKEQIKKLIQELDKTYKRKIEKGDVIAARAIREEILFWDKRLREYSTSHVIDGK